MRPKKRGMLVWLVISVIATGVLADDTGTVSIVGKNVDTTDPDTVGITLVLGTKKWTESEPGDRHHFFTTKGGIYIQVAPNLVILRDKDNTKRVGQLNPIEPDKAKKGDKGTGKSDESGIAFNWEVM